MKKIFLLILMLPLIVNAQVLTKKDIVPMAAMFYAGCADGFAEGLKYSSAFAGNKFFDPSISCMNKYRNGDPAQGEAFPMSTTMLVWTTDAYHWSRMQRNVAIVTGLTFKVGEKQKWYEYIFEAIAYYISFCTGFNITYELMRL